MNGNYNGYGGYNNGDYNNDGNRGYSFQTIMDIKSRNRGFAIASMIIGIFSILCCCSVWFGFVLGAFAVTLAVTSRVRMGYFDGLAIAGLVLGIIGLVFTVSTHLVSVVFLEEYVQWIESNYPEIYDELEGEMGTLV